MGHQPGDALAIMGKSATGQDHATACPDHLAIGELRAVDAPIAEQAHSRLVGEQGHAKVQGTAQQAGNQGVAVDQLQAAPMQQQVAAMAQHALGNVQGRLRRAAGVEEGCHVGPRRCPYPPG